MKIELTLSDSQIVHEKSMFAILDLLGAVGGLLDIFMALFAIFFNRYNSSLSLFYMIKDKI